jgi:hypothetical protein
MSFCFKPGRMNADAKALFIVSGLMGAALLLPTGSFAQSSDNDQVKSLSAPPGSFALFSGKQEDVTNNWTTRNPNQPAPWKVQDGAMVTSGTDICSKQKFTDFELHVEFKEPYLPDKHGQERGNSGVFLQGRYEIQVLDSYGVSDPGKGDCGAVYNQAAPLVKAYKPPLQWQTYDIVFRAPRFDSNGNKTENARVTVLLNGIAVQNNTEITGATGGEMNRDYNQPGPIMLQYHNNTVEFRNVWVLPLPLKGVDHY